MWVGSKEFAECNHCNYEALKKACIRAYRNGKKICAIKSNILYFTYAHGIGGNAGKVLRIWSEPFKTQAEAEAFMESYTQEQVDSLFYQKHPTLGSTQVAHPNTEYAAALSNTDSHKAQSSALCSIQSPHATTLEPISQTKGTTPTTPHKIGTSSVLAQEQAKALSCPSHFIQSAQSKTMFDNKDDDGQLRALDAFSKASQKDKNLALEKKSIIKEWEVYKARGVNAKDFIAPTVH